MTGDSKLDKQVELSFITVRQDSLRSPSNLLLESPAVCLSPDGIDGGKAHVRVADTWSHFGVCLASVLSDVGLVPYSRPNCTFLIFLFLFCFF